ncbi:MAG: DUF4957 domain-containing protein [Paludibacter sp.]|nr:DUF4957 domain-containing protein [Paludibacter sp.]
MKKFYFSLMVLCLTGMTSLYAADVLTLTTTEGIGATLNAYTGTNPDVTVVIPSGYTSPEFSTSNIILTTIPTVIKNLVIKGDGTSPTLMMKGFTLPVSSLTSFTVKDLTMKGIADPTSGTIALSNYFAQSAVTISTVTLDNCTIANFRSLFRMNAGNNFTDLTINNCIIRNIGSYNLFNPGGTLTNLTVSNSTIYGLNGNTFALSVTSPVPYPATFKISDCTFDNIDLVANKYFIDLGAANTTTVLTITNTILGKTLISTAKGIQLGTSYTVTNSYTTSDWVTAAGNVTGFTAYANASTSLFKSPSVYTSDATGTEASIGDYTLLDKSLGNIGDPRWYKVTGVLSPKASSKVIAVNGKKITLNEPQDIAIYSVTGELLKSAVKVKEIATGNLMKGIYIVKAGTAVQKFNIQ